MGCPAILALNRLPVPSMNGERLMIYTIARANLLADQFRRFKSLHVHHLAGLFANVDFWLHEVEEACRAIDEYNQRFSKLREAQVAWVKGFAVKEYRHCAICRGRCEFDDGTPQPPRRTSSQALRAARDALREEARAFVLCCYRAGLMGEPELRAMCARIGTDLEPSELDRAG